MNAAAFTPKPVPPNTRYYGDNLEVLRRHVDDESVDLIYLDPPLNSNADYNALSAEKDDTQAHTQITALEDTWSWNLEAAAEYAEVLCCGWDMGCVVIEKTQTTEGGYDGVDVTRADDNPSPTTLRNRGQQLRTATWLRSEVGNG